MISQEKIIIILLTYENHCWLQHFPVRELITSNHLTCRITLCRLILSHLFEEPGGRVLRP